MSQPATVSNPRVTFNLVTRDQVLGAADQRALFVGQLDPGRVATGNVLFAANPIASATVTIGGTVVTFVASGPTGSQVLIGASLAATLTNLKTFLNASADTNIVKATYDVSGTRLFVTFKTPGVTGNAFTLAASLATVSGATLTGGSAAPGTAVAGTLVSDLPPTDAEINALFGVGSQLAMMVRGWRSVNGYTNIDALPLADNAAATRAAAKVTFGGAATSDGVLRISAVSEAEHEFEVDVATGDTPDLVLAKLASVVAADRYQPFVYADNQEAIATFVAVNGGTHANTWLIKVTGSVPGLTVALTGWTGGATNPSLTGVFDLVDSIRYQTVVWPEAYAITTLKTFLNPRKNLDNQVKDGRGFTYRSDIFANLVALGQATNSSEVVIISNEITNLSTWIGPHLPEAPDVLAAKFAAARALRFETGISISNVITTNEASDQFGGVEMASLPYFNTPMLGVGNPAKGSGFIDSEQLLLRDAGISVVGVNPSLNGVVMGEVVTTWLNDAAGNPDDTWKYLEWRDTHGAVREILVANCRKRFSQYRLTSGDVIPNRAMANEAMVRGYLLELMAFCAGKALVVKGQRARQFIEDNMTVTLDLAARTVAVAITFPMVSQMAAINGTLKFTFQTAA
jgi:phage tail sheath gpL-like